MKTITAQISDLTAELAKANASLTAADERAKVSETDLKKAQDELSKLAIEAGELNSKVAKLEGANAKLTADIAEAHASAEAKAVAIIATRMGVDLSKSPDAAAGKSEENPKPTGRALVESAIAASFARSGIKI